MVEMMLGDGREPYVEMEASGVQAPVEKQIALQLLGLVKRQPLSQDVESCSS
jgi:hypothetical protein